MNTPNPNDAPPAYSPSQGFGSFTDEKFDSFLIVPPEGSEPGLAEASVLSRGLQVPSRSTTGTSGFEYPDELASYNVSNEHWMQFTQGIRDEAKLSGHQWKTVVGKGLGTLAVGGLMIGFLSAIPAIYVARQSKKRQEQRNLVSSLAGDRGEYLAQHISRWNETFFRPRGIMIRVDLSDEYLIDIGDVSIYRNSESSRSTEKKHNMADLKARVVIIPLD